MKKQKYLFLSGFLTVLVSVGVFAFAIAEDSGDNSIQGRKIIVFKDGLSSVERSSIISHAQGLKIRDMEHKDMMVAHLDAQAEEVLANDPNVVSIEDDVIVEAVDNKKLIQSKSSYIQPAQVLPWGINRIDAEQVWPLGDTGAGMSIGIIDTGISTSHPDLAGNIKGGVSEVRYTSSYNDDNGHGSHVAGIAGALSNSIGVIGVAPSVNLYAIKVLDRNGSGYLSDVINGIDWASAHNMKVVNMSLGCDCPSQAMHDAVIRAYNAGVTIVAAAGNSGGPVIYPAAYPEVIAVGATDSTNAVPYWSSRGPELDLTAPGVSIYSTYWTKRGGNTYTTLSGTSMASPHVAGTVALLLGTSISPTYDLNYDNMWQPDEVLKKLEATASGSGTRIDDVYGYGLVNALAAVTF